MAAIVVAGLRKSYGSCRPRRRRAVGRQLAPRRAARHPTIDVAPCGFQVRPLGAGCAGSVELGRAWATWGGAR
jgi:hypothetical protein